MARQVAAADGPLWLCGHCPEPFLTKRLAVQHESTHTLVKCDGCGQLTVASETGVVDIDFGQSSVVPMTLCAFCRQNRCSPPCDPLLDAIGAATSRESDIRPNALRDKRSRGASANPEVPE